MEIIGIQIMPLEEFFEIPTGTHVYNYGNDQCVALANLYTGGALQQPIPPGIQSAFQWWTTYAEKAALYDYFVQVPDSPKKGDIFVSKGGVYDNVHGHIGVVERDWDGSTFGTMENGYWNGVSAMKRFSRNMANVLGFLRPKALIPPTPPVDKKGKDMIVKVQCVDGFAALWNMTTGEYQHIDNPAEYKYFTELLEEFMFENEAHFVSIRDKYRKVFSV